ncbi:BOLA class I histocompatibility antigen, alpha chain BL3-7-like isoform X2 [Tachyglossus aculeatus]|uniref:BOLA class I histocompatibility antigen, alpha chain BL3-7-like isoform X2 n=1 Tax=Tachyglossus aculeatus TaxID=9261 RepID=UPI0018F77F8C|nr:BOLA class I histocompatibility antigen, alpha chain BL3-7-like isoform X2 [Tachyglossus aculeatus]
MCWRVVRMRTPAHPVLLLMLGLEVVWLPEACGRWHSLRYFYTGVTRPGLGVSEFTAVGYVDDMQFVRFNNDRGRAEPRASWIWNNEGPEYWDRETQILKGAAQAFRVGLQNVMGYYNQSKDGTHSFQLMCGCQLREDNTTGRGFYQYGYDGQDYLTLDKATLSWTAADGGAQNTKRKWEADRTIAKRQKAYLEGTCIDALRRYLRYGGPSLTRADPPTVRVTRHHGPDGDDVTLRCRALGFYPADIKFKWEWEGEDVSQEMEYVETRPSGDGKFQKWASLRVPQGEEQKYVCIVDHDGLAQPLAVRWAPDPSSSIGLIVGAVVALVIITSLVAGFVIWKKKKSGAKGGKYSPASSDSSLLVKASA